MLPFFSLSLSLSLRERIILHFVFRFIAPKESNFTKAVACYCVAAACGGAFVSFYYDTALSTPRAAAIVSCVFQMVGSVLIYMNSHSVLLASLLISAAFSAHILSLFPARAAAATPSFAKGAAAGEGSAGAGAGEENDGGQVQMLSPGGYRGNSGGNGADATPSGMREGPGSVGRLMGPGSVKRRPFSPITPMQSPGSAGVEDRPQVAHCVTQGMIMNEETNRLIGIGKGTYNKLVKGGWVVDKAIGVISPPSKQKKKD